jgi:subtilisin-like proprotein convertase family protein
MLASRPTKTRTTLILTLVTGCVLSLTPVGPAGAATTAVTKDESPDLAIAQASAVESTLTVAPGAGTVTGATVTVAATHTWIGDLVVRLTHVDTGTTVALLDRPGVVGVGDGDQSNLLQANPISFQDSPGLPGAETMGTGPGMGNNAVVCRDDAVCAFGSHETFGALVGLSASGDWRLSITDARSRDDGLLHAWTLQLETEPEVTTTVPGAPTSATAVAGDGAATVSWTAPESDGGSAITGYVVTPYVGADPLAPVAFASAATTQTLTGLTNGTGYSFEVAAVNVVGAGPSSGASNVVVPTLATVPGAPTSATAVAGDGAATVSWTAPESDGGSAILGYVVTPFVGFVSQGPRYFLSTATTQTVTGLTNGTTYRFKVRTWNAVGVSDFSSTSNAVTPIAPTVPGAPTIGVAVGGDGQATVSWSAPSSDGGSPIIGYVVTPYVGFVSQGPRYFLGSATTQTVTGLTNGTTYRFQVRAWNAVGVSAFSGTSNAVTPSP